MGAGIPMIVTFVVYILGVMVVGLLAWRATKNFDDFILGGRRLGSLVTALSAGASDMSGWLLMGLPGAIFVYGISKSWIAVGLVIGAYINWLLVAGRLRVHTEVNHNALTIPDYFTQRFEDKSKILRILSALVILVFFTIYCASGIVAGAQLFESTFQIDYSLALWLGAAATILYTAIGGFLAVSWIDTIQATLMIFALILTPIFVILNLGGIELSFERILLENPDNVNMMKNVSFIAVLSSLGWGLGYFGQPHILARFMAADSHRVMRNARRISMTWMILCLAGAIAVGFFGIAYFANNPSQATEVATNSELIFISLAKLLFNPWLAGILLSAILAAIMSTLSCQLLVCASAITEDLYKPFIHPKANQKELVWVGRIMVIVVSLIAIFIAYDPNSRVLSLVSYAWAGFGAAFGPVILLSVLWSRVTRNGAIAGMLVGAVTVLIWINYAWFGLYEIIPGFLFATLAIILVSLMDKPSESMLARFKQAEKELSSIE